METEITSSTVRPWNTQAKLSLEKATISTLMVSSTGVSGRRIRCRATERCTGQLLRCTLATGKATCATDRASRLG